MLKNIQEKMIIYLKLYLNLNDARTCGIIIMPRPWWSFDANSEIRITTMREF